MGLRSDARSTGIVMVNARLTALRNLQPREDLQAAARWASQRMGENRSALKSKGTEAATQLPSHREHHIVTGDEGYYAAITSCTYYIPASYLCQRRLRHISPTASSPLPLFAPRPLPFRRRSRRSACIGVHRRMALPFSAPRAAYRARHSRAPILPLNPPKVPQERFLPARATFFAPRHAAAHRDTPLTTTLSAPSQPILECAHRAREIALQLLIR